MKGPRGSSPRVGFVLFSWNRPEFLVDAYLESFIVILTVPIPFQTRLNRYGVRLWCLTIRAFPALFPVERAGIEPATSGLQSEPGWSP